MTFEEPTRPAPLGPPGPANAADAADPANPADAVYAPDPAPSAAAGDRPRLSPRTISLLAGFAATVTTGAILFALPVPYILETPGPTVDTLGSQDGVELIQIEGQPSHEVTGELRLTTVGAFGSDPGDLSVFQLVEGYLDPDDALVPYDLIYPRDSTSSEREAQSAAEMVTSQDSATAAALEYLGIRVSMLVQERQSGPAEAAFEPDDELMSIDGQPVIGFAALKRSLAEIAAGTEIAVGIIRDGEEITVDLVTSADQDGNALLGVTLRFEFPVTIGFGVEDIGGPSAGSMFALGIIDKLGPVDLAAGRVIAGTGTVNAEGEIGAIGGIRQKMIGAKRDGAEIFLAPAANCAEAAGNEPDGLRVVKVETVDDAVRALDALRAGDDASVPSCSD
ncbi:MAG: PDZ domain-containing protein [Bifidobacteriaceae bacterium]|nr:PDZ domain-containing protein [Bifidobacteriaceae bacterium]